MHKISVAHITSKGKTIYDGVDVSDLYYKFANDFGRDLIYDLKNDN